MPSIDVRAVGIADGPPWPDIADKIAVHDQSGAWRLCVLNGGMQSGRPSVGIAVPDGHGQWIVIETSLLAFLAAAGTARAMAETQFGWEMPA